MRAEDDDLLEGRPVRPAHRVRDEAGEADPLLRRVGPPGAGSGPCVAARSFAGRVERRPSSDAAARGEVAAPAELRRVRARDVSTEQRAEILVDVPVPAGAVGRAAVRVGVVEIGASCLRSSVRRRARAAGRRPRASARHASMIAAPGSSILPSPFASRRLAVGPSLPSEVEHLLRARRRRGVPCEHDVEQRHDQRRTRRSFVAAAFIAETTLAGVCFFACRRSC